VTSDALVRRRREPRRRVLLFEDVEREPPIWPRLEPAEAVVEIVDAAAVGRGFRRGGRLLLFFTTQSLTRCFVSR